MASVFLSYDREDAGRATLIAGTLRKAGHSVWWDQHIKSGTQYSKAIEQALEKADAVVVLWSAHSVESPWVRDEAATGRDRGRLIPVTLDGTEPPLGFRQFQTTDLSRWKGRRPSLQLQSLVADIEAIVGQQGPVPTATLKVAATDTQERPRRSLRILFAGGLLLLFIAVALFWWFRSPVSGMPTVSIVPADASPRSRQLSGAVRVALGDLQNSGAMAMRLLDADNGAGSNLLIKVRALGEGDQPSAEATLTSQPDQTILWSKQFDGSAGEHSSFKDVLAASVGLALGCATEAAEGHELSMESRRDFVRVCALIEEGADPKTLVPLLRKMSEASPNFAPAWAQLLNVEATAIQHSAPWSAAAEDRNQLQTDSEAAGEAFPKLPELLLAKRALASSQSFQQSLKLLDNAALRYPENANVLTARSEAWAKVGAMAAASADAKRASDLDRLSPVRLAAYASALTFQGELAEARMVLSSAQRRWPNARPLRDAETQIELRYGDFVKALPHSGERMDGGILAYIQARSQPTNANKDAFITLARTHDLNTSQKLFLLEALPGLDRVDDLYGLLNSWPTDRSLRESTGLLFSPWTAKFRRDPRFMVYARRLKLVEYWQATGNWPDFCSEPDMPYDCKAEAAKAAG